MGGAVNPAPPNTNNKIMIIADLTRAARSSEEDLIADLATHMSSTSPDEVVLTCRPDQILTLRQALPKAIVEVVRGTYRDVAEKVSSLIHQKGGSGKSIRVFSFHQAVLGLASSFPSVQFSHWREIITLRSAPKRTTWNQRASDPLANFQLGEDEILAALKAVLERRPRGVRLTDLRGALASERDDFDKEVNPQSGAPGFITAIIRIAERANLIHVDGTLDRQNPTVTLTQGGTADPEPTASSEAEAGSSHPESAEKEGANVDDRPQPPSRSSRLQQVIETADFGPFTQVRKELFDAIESLAAEKKHNSDTLIRAAVERAKDAVGEGKGGYPWWAVEKFLFRILGLRHVLIDTNGNAVNPHSFEGLTAVIAKPAPEWREKLEAEIVFVAIRDDGGVSAHDIIYLAGVLYGDRGENARMRVTNLLKRLGNDKRVEFHPISEDGIPVFKVVSDHPVESDSTQLKALDPVDEEPPKAAES